jgi:hypothetical protein
MNCGIFEGGFSVNVYTKSLCILVNKKVQKINSNICFVCAFKLKINMKRAGMCHM